MTTNNVRERFERDEAALGVRAETFSPVLVEVYGRLGFDFAWLDFEHGGPSPYDRTALRPLVDAAERGAIELLVRPHSGDPSLIHKLLDAGVRTLLIPCIETAEEVRRAVRAAQFVYDDGPGNRGWGFGAGHSGVGADEFAEHADENVLIGAMIERRRAVENIEAILSVPDLGFVFIGANDLSISLGHPRETDHPEVRGAIEQIEDACLDAGVPFGAPRHDTETAARALKAGYRILRVGDEVGAVREVLGRRLNVLRNRD